MKLHYYPDTDSLSIELKPDPGTETCEIVGFDIDHASARVDFSTLETPDLPLRTTRAA